MFRPTKSVDFVFEKLPLITIDVRNYFQTFLIAFRKCCKSSIKLTELLLQFDQLREANNGASHFTIQANDDETLILLQFLLKRVVQNKRKVNKVLAMITIKFCWDRSEDFIWRYLKLKIQNSSIEDFENSKATCLSRPSKKWCSHMEYSVDKRTRLMIWLSLCSDF